MSNLNPCHKIRKQSIGVVMLKMTGMKLICIKCHMCLFHVYSRDEENRFSVVFLISSFDVCDGMV